MQATFNTETLRIMTSFEEITGASVKDCLIDDETNTIYLVVKEGKIGIAIGKNGESVKRAEYAIKKNIKIFEFSADIASFVKNLIPKTNEINIRNEDGKIVVELRIDRNNKAVVIGRDGKNIKIFKELLQRNHNINDLIIK